MSELRNAGAALLGPDKVLAVFTATLLQLASKTITHTDTLFSRYSGVFRALAPEDRQRAQVLAAGALFFSSHPQGLSIWVDRLLCLGILTTESVVEARSASSLSPSIFAVNAPMPSYARRVLRGRRTSDTQGERSD